MTQRFWKFSVGRGRWANDIAIENNVIAIWGWDIVYFDMKKFDTDDSRETFEENLKKFLSRKNKLGKGSHPNYQQLADFYFLKKGDIIFLYGYDSYSIDAIGIVTEPYYYSPEKSGEVFDPKDPKQTFLVNVKWFYKGPTIHVRIEDLKKKISQNATILELAPEEALTILEISKWKNSTRNFSNYIELLSENQKLIDGPSEAEIRRAENEIERLSKEPFKLTGEARFVKTTKKARDAAFSRKIIEIYGGKCIICGSRWQVDGSFEAEAAHIVPKEENGTDDPRNGLTLCRFHHWAFDKGLFSINESYRIIVSPHVQKFSEPFKNLQAFADKEIIPNREESRPHKDALKWHFEHVFKK